MPKTNEFGDIEIDSPERNEFGDVAVADNRNEFGDVAVAEPARESLRAHMGDDVDRLPFRTDNGFIATRPGAPSPSLSPVSDGDPMGQIQKPNFNDLINPIEGPRKADIALRQQEFQRVGPSVIQEPNTGAPLIGEIPKLPSVPTDPNASYFEQVGTEAGNTVSGIANFASGIVNFLQSSDGLALMATGKLPVGSAMRRSVFGTFAGVIVKDMPHVAHELVDRIKKGDTSGAIEQTVNLLALPVFAKHMGKQALTKAPPKPAGPEGEMLIQPPPIERPNEPKAIQGDPLQQPRLSERPIAEGDGTVQVAQELDKSDSLGREEVANVTTPKPAPVEPPKAEVRAESAEERLGNIVNETIDQSNNAQKLGIRPGASSRSTDVVLGDPDLKSVSPKVEARWQAAVKEKPSVLDRVKVGAENAWKSVTREYADLPPRQYPQEIDILRRLRASPNASARQAADVLRGITINLGPKQYGVFGRVLALEDLVKDVQSGKYGEGKELPFGYESADQLNIDLAKFKSIADATPQITDALNKRRDFNESLKNTLVERGFLPKEVLDDPRYFHHQVLLYLAEQGGAGGPKSFRDWFSGWQKKRTGSALDYNRQYIEAEAEVVADAFKKIRMQDLQAEMRQKSDLKDSLVDLHGKEWKQHIPKSHTLWQPKKGNAFYPARTVAEKVMDQYLEGLRDILPEDFKEALVVGGKRQEWVIPKELSKVLDNLAPRNESWIERFAESANSAWKKFILLMPLRAIKYMANNVSGDIDFMFAANPKIFREFKQSAVDSWGFHEKGKAATGDIKEAVDMGVMGSGFRASELGDISRSDYFNWLTGEKPGLIDRYWNGIAKLNDAREDIGRLATYRFARKEFDAGRKFYGASVPRDIDALPTNKLKAAKVARELLIDYGRETEFGEYARRKVVPFYRWMHGNFARYIQLIKNIPEQEGAAGKRLAAVTGTKLAARMAFAYAAVNMWNHLMFPKEEEELGEGRNQLHLILGRDDQGNIQTLRFQGALSDLLGWVGGENLPQDIEDIAKGTSTVGDKMEDAGEAAVSKAVNASFPFAKTGAETLTKRSLYPNALKPSPIRDRGEHVAGLFGLKNIYKWISGKPHRPLRQEIAGLIAYTTDPGEAAYNATRHMAGEWLEDKGEDKGSFIPSKRSNALYFHKQALRYKDSKMAAKFLTEYEKLGGTEAGLNKSLDASEPLKMLGKRKNDFLESLSPQERATVQRAEEWYDRVLK